jgi:KaiC/GvpD/RAD55 family RecA-like ATPase
MFPENYSILVSGDPSSGMFEFCCYLASTHLRGGESLVFLEADTSPSHVREQLRLFGANPSSYESSGSLSIVDCYSPKSDESGGCDLSDMNSIMSCLSESLEGVRPGPAMVLFDSLTPLFLHHDDRTVNKLLRELSTRSKLRGTLTCTIHRGIVREDQIQSMSSVCDGLMEMRVDDSFRRFVRIKHMRGLQIAPRWVPFDFEPVEEEEGGGTFLSWRRE